MPFRIITFSCRGSRCRGLDISRALQSAWKPPRGAAAAPSCSGVVLIACPAGVEPSGFYVKLCWSVRMFGGIC